MNKNVGHRKSDFTIKARDCAVVIAFDPGETTGYCVMGVNPDALLGAKDSKDSLQDRLELLDYGEIDCSITAAVGAKSERDKNLEAMVRKHGGLNLPGENFGVAKMVSMAGIKFPTAAIVLEDFILDFKKADQARHTLSPVRITSAFSYGLHAALGPGAIRRIHIQGRSLAKTTCTDDRLKRWNLYDRNSGPHARDAVRHAFYFLRDRRGNGSGGKDSTGAGQALKRWGAWPHLFPDPMVTTLGNDRDIDRQAARQAKPRPVGERIEGLS